MHSCLQPCLCYFRATLCILHFCNKYKTICVCTFFLIINDYRALVKLIHKRRKSRLIFWLSAYKCSGHHLGRHLLCSIFWSLISWGSETVSGTFVDWQLISLFPTGGYKVGITVLKFWLSLTWIDPWVYHINYVFKYIDEDILLVCIIYIYYSFWLVLKKKTTKQKVSWQIIPEVIISLAVNMLMQYTLTQTKKANYIHTTDRYILVSSFMNKHFQFHTKFELLVERKSKPNIYPGIILLCLFFLYLHVSWLSIIVNSLGLLYS